MTSKYRVVQELGVGGMGKVYKGLLIGQSGFQRPIVLKVLRDDDDPAHLRLFVEEARRYALLDHENIGRIVDFERVDGRMCIILEYIDGWSVVDFLERHGQGRLPDVELVVFIVSRVCRALQYVFEKVRTVDRLVSGFLRGQLLVAATLGVLYAIGFGVIGIDLAIGVGLLAGALALVPYLGNVVAVAAASALCVLEFGIDWHLAAVLGWYAFCQNLEGFVLTPRIVGGSVGLHPALVIVALLIGGDLFGFLGLLIAVPAAAVVKVFVAELLELYSGSQLFGDETAAGGEPPPAS